MQSTKKANTIDERHTEMLDKFHYDETLVIPRLKTHSDFLIKLSNLFSLDSFLMIQFCDL